MSRRVLLTGLTMLVGATPVPSQLLIRDERIEAISRGRSNALDGDESSSYPTRLFYAFNKTIVGGGR